MKLTPARLSLFFGLYALLAFVVLAEKVFRSGAMVPFDELQAERLFTLGQRQPGLYETFRFLTNFGAGWPLNLFATGIPVLIVLRGQYALALLFLASCLLNRELNILLKEQFERLRPIFTDPEFRRTSWSFPSGHAQNSMFIYGFAIYLGFLAYPRWRWWIGTSLMLLVIAIGLSRMILGVHFFSDVLGGFLIALAGLSVCIAIIESSRRKALGSAG
jgi:undecaprenyl-diphosphatase